MIDSPWDEHYTTFRPNPSRYPDFAEMARYTGLMEPRNFGIFADFLRERSRSLADDSRYLAKEYVEGFQAAPPGEMSAAMLEGATLDTAAQFVPPQGFSRLIDGLARRARARGVRIRLGAVARRIGWEQGRVVVRTTDEMEHCARAAVLTVPLGVLQAGDRQRGAILFHPPLGTKARLIAKMRTGHVVRITLRFEARQWRVIVPDALRRSLGLSTAPPA